MDRLPLMLKNIETLENVDNIFCSVLGVLQLCGIRSKTRKSTYGFDQLSIELRPHKAITVGDTPARDACRARTRI